MKKSKLEITKSSKLAEMTENVLYVSSPLIFMFIIFFIWVLRPFQEYFTYIEPIVHQSWSKTGEPGEKHLTILKQNVAFPHVTQARLKPQR